MIEFQIGDDVAGRARIGVLTIEGVAVRARDPLLDAEVDGLCSSLRERYGQGKSSELPGAQDARALYKALGIDPTKTRPSSESLARRALKGETLYRINTLVDALNLVSLREQLSFGLYDLRRVHPPVTLRKGRPGEAYEGIRKGVSTSRVGLCSWMPRARSGTRRSDSLRTSITPETRDALVVAYAPSSCDAARLGSVLTRTADTLVRFCGGVPGESRIL